ncbi:helix-turn-helix domain-containing protein [Clostridium faecium]|uniref:Helix-turn-helix transcriptional regulator n=1 Tax=Clostridium faecium TaxID=2762223 RepID=A0ABR8YU87_9CLOT|nr:helix-turn-helix transcriptional regulator [Clostridium faecium]MBD8047795.1 helix-turn-helix transcriptional regulator [Clostridium faecium]
MIIFHLAEILRDNDISQNQFARMSNIRPNTINEIVNNTLKRLELDTFAKLLIALKQIGYSVDDLIEVKEL